MTSIALPAGIYQVGRHQFQVRDGLVRYYSAKRGTASRNVVGRVTPDGITATGNGLGMAPWLAELAAGHATVVKAAKVRAA